MHALLKNPITTVSDEMAPRYTSLCEFVGAITLQMVNEAWQQSMFQALVDYLMRLQEVKSLLGLAADCAVSHLLTLRSCLESLPGELQELVLRLARADGTK